MGAHPGRRRQRRPRGGGGKPAALGRRRRRTMIERIVAMALKAPAIIFILAMGIIVAGLHSYRELDIEAYPNPVPPLVEVIAQPDGMSAEDVERYVTVPIEIALAGIPGLE